MSIQERPTVASVALHVKRLQAANPSWTLQQAGDLADDEQAKELHRLAKWASAEHVLRLHKHHANTEHSRNVKEVRAPVNVQEVEAATRRLMPYGARNLRRRIG
jgi:hypothetical protein